MTTRYSIERSSKKLIDNNEKNIKKVIDELTEKMSRLKFRLLDCQNQNQMLRKELLLAKKVVNAELIGRPNDNFKELLDQANTSNFRGRKEKILLLKDRLNTLQKRIKELEEDDLETPPESSREITKVQKFPEQRKIENKQIMDKELQYLIENSCQMKRKLEVWKKRNAELNKEAEQLRLERDRLIEKSKEDKNVHESYRVVEKDLRARQVEKLDMRSKLDLEKTRNEQLSQEREMVKEDLSQMFSKTNDDKALIDALNNQKGHLLDLLERQKMISESDNRRYRDDLREIQMKHASNSNVLSHLHDIVEEKRLTCQKVEEITKNKLSINAAKEKRDEVESLSTVTAQSETSQPEESVSPSIPDRDLQLQQGVDEQNQVEAGNEIAKISEECETYKSLLKSVQEEVEQLTKTVLTNDGRIKEWESQLLQSRSMYAQKNAEVSELEDTANRMERSASTKKGSALPKPRSGFNDEMIKMSDVLNEEYQFLFSLWEILMTNKENSLEVLMLSVDSRNKVFEIEITDLMANDLSIKKVQPQSSAEIKT